MPSLKAIASIEVEFTWIMHPRNNDTDINVFVRVVINGGAWGIGSIIRNQSVSQSVTSYNKLRQKLDEYFPRQGHASSEADVSLEHDVAYALSLAKAAAQRMPTGTSPHRFFALV
jgi:hypothetical protein